MWRNLLDHLLSRFVRTGELNLTFSDGTTRRYGGAAGTDGPQVAVTLHDPGLPRRIVTSPDLAIGEGYMDQRLTIEGDDLDGFVELVCRNADASRGLWWRRVSNGLQTARRRVDQWNPTTRARANVAHHYDLSSDLYDLFLDADRQYSCAYFADPAMDLDTAQSAKKHHIARKLLLQPGMEVLDIGCGWGGMALTLARDYGARVTGITLSTEQHRMATERAEAAGLSDRVHFHLRDYRTLTGRFDRIVSIGMFEHVGVPHYRTYFDTIRQRLAPDGVALIHTIGRARPPGATSPWIAKYIFPGGYIPALSEMSAAVEGAGLYPTDLEVWRLHYAETLRHWHDRFVARQDEARALYDERFCRMWRYYLKISEHSFRHLRQCVFQMQLAHDQAAVPLTREYLHVAEARAEAAE